MRLIEPQQIVIQETAIDLGVDADVALISDMHLGVYKDQRYMHRVVDILNQQEIDMVLIAGDFLNHPLSSQTLEWLLWPLASLQVPRYAVMGNHDVGFPGDDLGNELTRVLDQLGGQVIDNQFVQLDGWTLVWLWSHLAGDDNVFLLDQFALDEKVVVLTHNPDVTLNYKDTTADLTLVGHTHCGQIRIPYLYESYREAIMPTDGPFDCGWSQERFTQLFISPGLGEVILPMRFMNPPTISILHL